MSQRKKKVKKISRERMTELLLESGFTQEQIKEHFRNKDQQASKKKKKNKKAVIFLGYNTVSK